MVQGGPGRQSPAGVVHQQLLQEVDGLLLHARLVEVLVQPVVPPVGEAGLQHTVITGWWGPVSTLKSGRLVTPGHISSVGVLRIMKIFKIWSISESPRKRGLLISISAKIVPTDQMSIGQEYLGEPKYVVSCQ